MKHMPQVHQYSTPSPESVGRQFSGATSVIHCETYIRALHTHIICTYACTFKFTVGLGKFTMHEVGITCSCSIT